MYNTTQWRGVLYLHIHNLFIGDGLPRAFFCRAAILPKVRVRDYLMPGFLDGECFSLDVVCVESSYLLAFSFSSTLGSIPTPTSYFIKEAVQ